MKAEIRKIISEIEQRHVNDPGISDELDRITKILAGNESEAIETINDLDENLIDWIAPLFSDLSALFQSREFIKTIVALEAKFPALDLQRWTRNAIKRTNSTTM
jgi:hypothetical protein